MKQLLEVEIYAWLAVLFAAAWLVAPPPAWFLLWMACGCLGIAVAGAVWRVPGALALDYGHAMRPYRLVMARRGLGDDPDALDPDLIDWGERT